MLELFIYTYLGKYKKNGLFLNRFTGILHPTKNFPHPLHFFLSKTLGHKSLSLLKRQAFESIGAFSYSKNEKIIFSLWKSLIWALGPLWGGGYPQGLLLVGCFSGRLPDMS